MASRARRRTTRPIDWKGIHIPATDFLIRLFTALNALPVEVAEAVWERLAEILSIFGPLAAGPMPRLQAERRW